MTGVSPDRTISRLRSQLPRGKSKSVTQSHYEKPRFSKAPGAWLKRKLKLKLSDLIEPAGLRVLERVDFSALKAPRPFAHILDVGVADGTPDLYRQFPDALLELFEPSPEHHVRLERHVLGKRTGRLHRVAAGAADGQAVLSVTGRTGSTLLGIAASKAKDAAMVEVPVQRLDGLLSVAEIRRPCLLKIDTEGYELEVLRGASGLMAAIDAVVVEVHFDKPQSYAAHEIFDFLAGYGFRMTDMLDHHVCAGRVVCADLVFERSG